MLTFKFFGKTFQHKPSRTNPLSYILVPLWAIFTILLAIFAIPFTLIIFPLIAGICLGLEAVFPKLRGKLVQVTVTTN